MSTTEFDVIVVGAGFAGMYALYRFREAGLSVRVIEAGDDVGGTWYWNRYPGARCDVPTVEYSYSFSKELEQEWEWPEVMSGQPEILAYANHVADRFQLRRDMQFNTRVTTAVFDEAASLWRVGTDQGDALSASFCVMATGCLSMPFFPSIPGLESFAGPVHHTGLWPKEAVRFEGKRVGLIGTGSSGVQSIPVIAETAAHLTVFQRTAEYTLPANNRPLDSEALTHARRHYDEIRALQRESYAGISGFGMRAPSGKVWNIKEATQEQREKALARFGLAAVSAWADVRTDLEANEIACELYRSKVFEIINDPVMAEKLCPRGYPIGCKRQVFDTNYYEAFNRDNVSLVDLRQEPLETVTATGIRTSAALHELDMVILATGFDAMTGAVNRVDIRGREGRQLKAKWADGPKAYLGLMSAGFPNLFMITGPGSPSVLSNMIVSIEQHVDWINDCLRHMRADGTATIEPVVEAEEQWVQHVNEVAVGSMFTAPTCNSWYLGANVPGKPRIFMPYVGGLGRYRRKCEEVAANGYAGFQLGKR
jgi:cyclohexanone monooxygenase